MVAEDSATRPQILTDSLIYRALGYPYDPTKQCCRQPGQSLCGHQDGSHALLQQMVYCRRRTGRPTQSTPGGLRPCCPRLQAGSCKDRARIYAHHFGIQRALKNAREICRGVRLEREQGPEGKVQGGEVLSE